MPAFVAGAVAAAGTFAYVATYLAVTVIITAGLSYAMRPRKQRPGFESRFRDVSVRGTIEPMQIIYGQVKTPGFIAFIGTSGALDRFLHFVVVLAAHQCESITQVWLDSRTVPDADIDSSGVVSTSAFQDGGSRLLIRRFLGTNAQAADSELVSAFAGTWTTNHRGAGVAYMHVRLDYSEAVYPNGAPNSLFALVSGRRVYDPRLDSTNGGSGSHRFTDATTWAYNNLASLCIRDYLSGGSRWYDVATPEPRLGFAAPNSRIDDAYTIAATNIDDEDVLIPPASPTTTQKRYTCDVQLSCGGGDTHRENLRKLESASVGKVAYVNGRYRIHSGAYDTPTITIGEDDILGPMTVSPHPFGEELYNYVTGTFFDEARDWQELPFPNITNSSFETADGGQFKREVRLEATRTSYRCQRIGILHLAKSRHKKVVKFEKLSAKALQLTHHSTFMVTCSEFGFASKVFRVIEPPEIQLPDLTVAITAREEESTSYADPAVGDYAAPGTATVPTPSLEQPVVPTNFTAVSMPEGILFTWVAPAPRNNATMYHLYEHTAITPFSSATRVWSGNALSVLLERSGYTTRFYWMTSSLNGVESAATPVGNGLAASPSLQGFQATMHDSFEHQDVDRFYDDAGVATTPIITYPTNGENGGRVLRAEGYVRFRWRKNIPYDPTKRYLFSARVRMVQAPTGGVSTQDFVYAGLDGFEADGTTITAQHWIAANNLDMGAFTLGDWVVISGYMSGLAASPSPQPAPEISDPCEGFSSGSDITRFIRPHIILNYVGGNGIMEVDYIRLRVVTDTEDLAPDAATGLFADSDDFAGGSAGTTTRQSFTFTPERDCTLEISALAVADNVLGDAGNFLRLTVTPTAGSTTTLATTGANTTSRVQHAMDANYAAAGGVEITIVHGQFVTGGNPNIAMWTASLRIAEVKA